MQESIENQICTRWSSGQQWGKTLPTGVLLNQRSHLCSFKSGIIGSIWGFKHFWKDGRLGKDSAGKAGMVTLCCRMLHCERKLRPALEQASHQPVTSGAPKQLSSPGLQMGSPRAGPARTAKHFNVPLYKWATLERKEKNVHISIGLALGKLLSFPIKLFTHSFSDL